MKSRAKFCRTYAAFSSRDTFLDFLSLHGFFQPGALKTKATLDWRMNERLETNVEVR